MKSLILAACAGTLLATGVQAAEADRYQMEKSGEGYVRLDRLTGEMSICTEQAGQLVCRLAADERKAYGDGIEALTNRVDALESRLAALEARPPATNELPSEEEFDKALGFMERFFKRFMEIVRGLEGGDDGIPRKT